MRRSESLERYDDGNGGLGHEGTGRRSDEKVANLTVQMKSVAVDDWTAVKSPSVVADGYFDPDACATDDMHENMSSLPTVEPMLHRVG